MVLSQVWVAPVSSEMRGHGCTVFMTGGSLDHHECSPFVQAGHVPPQPALTRGERPAVLVILEDCRPGITSLLIWCDVSMWSSPSRFGESRVAAVQHSWLEAGETVMNAVHPCPYVPLFRLGMQATLHNIYYLLCQCDICHTFFGFWLRQEPKERWCPEIASPSGEIASP